MVESPCSPSGVRKLCVPFSSQSRSRVTMSAVLEGRRPLSLKKARRLAELTIYSAPTPLRGGSPLRRG